MHVADIITF